MVTFWNPGTNTFALCVAVTTITCWGEWVGPRPRSFHDSLHPSQVPAMQGCWVQETLTMVTRITEQCLVALYFTPTCPGQGSLLFVSLLLSSPREKSPLSARALWRPLVLINTTITNNESTSGRSS